MVFRISGLVLFYYPRIKRQDVCRSKKEGGLDFPNLGLYNKCMIIKQLWDICANTEFLWVKWVHSILLRDANVWSVKTLGDRSWAWRKILSVRSIFQLLVECKIGNSSRTSIWFDSWHPMGPLYLNFSEALIRSFNCTKKDTVDMCIVNGNWNWPKGWRVTPEVMRLNASTLAHFIPKENKRDKVYWKPHKQGILTIKTAMKALRTPAAN